MAFEDIEDKVDAWFLNRVDDADTRFRSWEHCYDFFQQHKCDISSQCNLAALHLGFYLASWGMYRGSSFLLRKYDYTIHRRVIDYLTLPKYSVLWDKHLGSETCHEQLVPIVLNVIDDVREAYKPEQPSDILVTKVILGTIGCLPACDEYFKGGFKKKGFKYTRTNGQPNQHFIKQVFGFCREHVGKLIAVQEKINKERRKSYPLMKLVDMYFYQIGYELKIQNANSV
jgi:hypothetical protein